MLLIVVISILAFISGIANQIADLIKFDNNIQKGKFKKWVKYISLIIFILTAGFTTYQVIDNQITAKAEKKHTDSLLLKTHLEDSIAYASLVKENVKLADSLKNLHKGLSKLEMATSTLISSQTVAFLSTAKKIRNSADTLLKYINGNEGYLYADVVLNPVGGSFLILVNQNKHTLKDCYIQINYRRSLDTSLKVINGLKVIDRRQLEASALLSKEYPSFAPGAKTTTLRVNNLAVTTLIANISVNGDKYYEELSCEYSRRAYKIYKVERNGKYVLIKEFNVNAKFDWKLEFPNSMEGVYVSIN